MQTRDYFERMIQQIAAAVARVIGLALQGSTDEAERELDDAWFSTVGLKRADAARFDDTMLRMVLGAKTPHAAKLFEAEAAVAEARGKTAAAEALRKRAAALGKG